MDCSVSGFHCPWDFTGNNTGVGCHFLLQGIFPTQGSNLHLLRCRQILYHWATGEARWRLKKQANMWKHSIVEKKRGLQVCASWRLLALESWKARGGLTWSGTSYVIGRVLSHSVMSNSLQPHGLQPARFLYPWNSPGKDTGVGYHSPLQGIFTTRHQTRVFCIAARFFTIWATREAHMVG